MLTKASFAGIVSNLYGTSLLRLLVLASSFKDHHVATGRGSMGIWQKCNKITAIGASRAIIFFVRISAIRPIFSV
jgi:hypothetical protein